MSARHTPGPWEISRYTNYVGFSIHAHGAGCIAERWWPTELTEGFNEEVKANANLIAAAPELLEALKKVEEALKKDSRGKTITGDPVEYHLDGQEMYHAINLVRAAIARAEGGQP